MKKLFIVISILIFLSGCNTVDTDHSRISALSVSIIDPIRTHGNSITVTITVTIPTPCWYYLKTEKSQSNSIYSAKIFGKYDDEICVQVLS